MISKLKISVIIHDNQPRQIPSLTLQEKALLSPEEAYGLGTSRAWKTDIALSPAIISLKEKWELLRQIFPELNREDFLSIRDTIAEKIDISQRL